MAARDIPSTCYALVDVYGQCDQVTIVTNNDDATATNTAIEYREKADMEEGSFQDNHNCRNKNGEKFEIYWCQIIFDVIIIGMFSQTLNDILHYI